MQPRAKAGFILFIGSVQFLILMIVAETQYPGYSPSDNYISDLGLWEYGSAFIFNPSVVLFGIFGVIGSYLLLKETEWRRLAVLMMISGFAAIGVGVFNEDVEGVHTVVSAIAFASMAAAAITSYWYLPRTMGMVGLFMGAVALVAMALMGTRVHFGMGMGGIERMILYPVLGWFLGFSGYLMACECDPRK